MRTVAGVLGLAVAACSPTSLPPWAQRGERRALGDDTIATPDSKPVAIPRFSKPPVLDGKADEAEWSGAAVLGPFVDTGDGRVLLKHPVAGFARAGWDDQNLYLAFVVEDRDPTTPFARDTTDPHIFAKASGIELMLQPGDLSDNRDYYELQVDPSGALFDTRWDDYMKPVTKTGDTKIFGHLDWQSGLQRAVFVQKGTFWSVEVALPWAKLAPTRVAAPPVRGDVWRMNLYTFRDGQRQALGWSSIRGEGNFHKSSRWGRVVFE